MHNLSKVLFSLITALSLDSLAVAAPSSSFEYHIPVSKLAVTPKVTAQSIVLTNGYRTWADGTLAPSCSAYLAGDASHLYAGSTGDGIYRVSLGGTPANVYCDMTTDGGGWMLAAYTNATVASFSYHMSDVLVRGYPLKTITLDTTNYPVLPNGITNNFTRILHKGGTTAWQTKMGAWVSWATVGSAPLSTTLPGAKTASGLSALYLSGAGWGYSTAAAADWFILWDAPGISPICGGAGVSAPNNCPAYVRYAWTDLGVSPHFDVNSHRQLYVR